MSEKIKTEIPKIETRVKTKLESWVENRTKDIKPKDFSSEYSTYEEIKKYFDTFSSGEKVSKLYDLLSSYFKIEKPGGAELPEGNAELEKAKKEILSYAKILWDDEATKQGLLEVFARGTGERKFLRESSVGKINENLIREIKDICRKYEDLNQRVWMGKINPVLASKLKIDLGKLAQDLVEKRGDQEDLLGLKKLEHAPENTDAVAQAQYKKFLEYQKQLSDGFVWLPSRLGIHQKTIEQLQNGRWPILMGEAGTGKSEQADAAAKMLTGELPENITCTDRTGEKELIAKTEIDAEGSYEVYGAAMRAMTGFDNSRQKEVVRTMARMLRLDEINRMSGQSPGYSILKMLRQLKAGRVYKGKEILPGFGAIGTANPSGPRYDDRYEMDAAMQREFANIIVDYPPMTHSDPELYEFMISVIMDEKGFINADEKEIAPAYKEKDFSIDEIETLADGRKVVGKKEIIESANDKSHGYLYRLAFAIKSVQDAFVHYQDEGDFPGVLKFTKDANGKLKIDPNGSEKLTLSKATITLYDVASWMKGFRERMGKDNPEYQTKNLSGFMKYKLESYIDGLSDKEDKERVRAVFDHFRLFDIDDVAFEKPLTPQEIGYLSPRTPRPLKLQDPIEGDGSPGDENNGNEGGGKPPAPPEFLGTEIMIRNPDGSTKMILMDKKSITVNIQGKEKGIYPGTRLMLSGEKLIFMGLLTGDENTVILSEDGNIGREVVRAELENAEFSSQFISEFGPESKEKPIEIDFESEKQSWNKFYDRHKIKDSAGNIFKIPENLQLTSESVEKARELIKKFGFNKMMIIPRGITPNNLIQNDSVMNDYPDRKKANTHYFNDNIKNSGVLDIPSSDYQIIFLKEKPTADAPQDHTTETHNKAYPQILEQEKQLDLEGLDITQFFIYHRYYYDKYQKHPHVWQENQAIWLTKTAEKVSSGYSVSASWNSDDGKFFFYLYSSFYSDPSLGSVFSRGLEHKEID